MNKVLQYSLCTLTLGGCATGPATNRTIAEYEFQIEKTCVDKPQPDSGTTLSFRLPVANVNTPRQGLGALSLLFPGHNVYTITSEVVGSLVVAHWVTSRLPSNICQPLTDGQISEGVGKLHRCVVWLQQIHTPAIVIGGEHLNEVRQTEDGNPCR